jgi:hypothetical protein
MNKLKGSLILLVIFIISVYCSFLFEKSYRNLIRYLYEFLSNGRIFFYLPHKHFNFPSPKFILSFGLFMVTFSFLIFKQTSKQSVVNIGLGIFLIVVSTLVHSYLDSLYKIIECTACNDGVRLLHYNDINYFDIFISSLISGIIPTAITAIKTYRNIKVQAKKKPVYNN